MSKKKATGAGSPVTETSWCCRCTSCDFQVVYYNESPDEHDCSYCDECWDVLQEIAAPIKERVRIEEHIDMQKDKIKRYQSLSSRIDVSQPLQREKKILRRLMEKLAQLDENGVGIIDF